MNLLETQTWLGSILPAECAWSEVSAAGSGSRSFTVGSLFINDDNAAATPATYPAGSASTEQRQVLACTCDAAEISTGLTSPDGFDVRSEILSVGFGREGELEQLVSAAASMLGEDDAERLAQPGTFLPGLAERVNPALTAKHGLLVVPYIWQQGVPQVREDPTITGPDGQDLEFTDPGRMTLIVQLIMLTESEFLTGMTRGIDTLQQQLAAAGTDVRDLRR